jgi:hypothetical protein
VDVSTNVRIVDPVVTQLVTQRPRPDLRGGCARSVVRAGAYGSGPTRTRQPAEVVALFDAVDHPQAGSFQVIDSRWVNPREPSARGCPLAWLPTRVCADRLVRRLVGGTDMHRQPRRSYAPSKTEEPAPTT